MKKIISLVIVLIFVLSISACGNDMPPVTKGDFSFTLPDGYSVQNLTEIDCTFLRDEDGARVGGAEVTPLRKRDLCNKGITKIMKYLQEEFHKTNNVEFFSFAGEGDTPYVNISLQRPNETGQYKRHFSHLFFFKDDAVYHVWLDTDVIDEEIRQHILDIFVSLEEK